MERKVEMVDIPYVSYLYNKAGKPVACITSAKIVQELHTEFDCEGHDVVISDLKYLDIRAASIADPSEIFGWHSPTQTT